MKGTAKNGKTVVVRRIEISDADAVERFYKGVSATTSYKRFHGIIKDPWKTIDHFCADKFVIAALCDEDIIGIGELHTPSGEIAMIVTDSWQKQGIASMLLESMKQYARRNGIPKLIGNILFSNTEVVRFSRKHGFQSIKSMRNEAIMVLTIN